MKASSAKILAPASKAERNNEQDADPGTTI